MIDAKTFAMRLIKADEDMRARFDDCWDIAVKQRNHKMLKALQAFKDSMEKRDSMMLERANEMTKEDGS